MTTALTYPVEGYGAPKHRRGSSTGETGLPAGTTVFSADNHISLSEDIFVERFPASMRARAPRVICEDGAWTLAFGERGFLPKDFTAVLTQYDPCAGATTGDLPARAAELASDGIDRELAFPNAMLGLMGWPDHEVRELCFRIYNEYIAELQAASAGRFYGVGLINWWDPVGCRRTLSEIVELALTTFWLPLKPGRDLDGTPIDYTGPNMDPIWAAIEESGLPVSHHIGEAPLGSPCQEGGVLVGMLHNAAPFREMFGRYLFGGILDRHPGLRIGWFEGGINWVPAAIQDARHLAASAGHMVSHQLHHDIEHYWHHHMWASFMVDPLGLDLIDRIGIDRVMWSSDYPHNESTFGYTEVALRAVVDAVGPDQAVKVVEANVADYLGVAR